MKKVLCLLLAAGMAVSGSVALAQSDMESVLTEVKSKVEIPGELSEFETSKSYRGEECFYFRWSDADGEKNMAVEANGEGNILSYSYYSQDMYDESRMKIDEGFEITKMQEFATENLKKMVPELFANENDLLVAVPYSDPMKLSSQSRYNFFYEREHRGVKVKDNSASVSIINTSDGFVINNVNIIWDYKTEFAEYDEIRINQTAGLAWLENFPVKLQYRTNYEGEFVLEYFAAGGAYQDNETLKEVFEDEISVEEFAKFSRAEDAVSTAGGQNLTPAERKEIDKISKLKTTEELLEILYSMPELGVKKSVDLEEADVYTYPYNNDDEETKYATSIYLPEKKIVDGEEITRSSANAYFDAQTGELLSFYRYSYDGAGEKKEDSKAGEKADAFLKKYYSDKLSQTQKDEEREEAYYVRMVNDIPYIDNNISAAWDVENDCIGRFSQKWDEDISKMPAPDGIISLYDAENILFENAPLELLYLKSGGKYIIVNTLPTYEVRIDAKSGKVINYDGEEKKEDKKKEYSDIQGHWVENIANKLAEYGIAFEESELKPDEQITQADFLRLVYSGMLGSSWDSEEDTIYYRMVDKGVISKEERNSTSPINRETAIRYLLRAMEIKEVAEIEGIYICRFADSGDISPDKLGYCAIAGGFGIVKGDGGYLYPQKDITRAEALTMIYNYLTR